MLRDGEEAFGLWISRLRVVLDLGAVCEVAHLMRDQCGDANDLERAPCVVADVHRPPLWVCKHKQSILGAIVFVTKPPIKSIKLSNKASVYWFQNHKMSYENIHENQVAVGLRLYIDMYSPRRLYTIHLKYEPGAFGALSGWGRALPLVGGAPALERPRPRPT